MSCHASTEGASTLLPVIVFADSHLTVGRPERTRLVLDFLDTLPGRTNQVYILGDLFDFWLGRKHLLLPDYSDLLGKLRELTESGMEIRMIRGNRDFLIDSSFAEHTGVQLLGDYFDLDVGEQKVRMTHGDLLCTADWRYLMWRRVVRHPVVRGCVRLMPLFATRALAVRMREFSENEIRRKKMKQAVGIVEAAAIEAMDEKSDFLIVGHAHTPGTRAFTVDGEEKMMYVLGDWKEQGIYLQLSSDGIEHWKFSREGDNPVEVPHQPNWD